MIKSTIKLECGTEITICGTMENVIKVMQTLNASVQKSPTFADPEFAAARNLARRSLDGGRRIEAIKLYREKTGCSLKESKEEVDRIIHLEYPHLLDPYPQLEPLD